MSSTELSVSYGRKFATLMNITKQITRGIVTDENWLDQYNKVESAFSMILEGEKHSVIQAAITGALTHIQRHGENTDAFYSILMYSDGMVGKYLYVFNPISRTYSIIVKHEATLREAYQWYWITKPCYQFLKHIDAYPNWLTTGIHAHKTLNVQVKDLLDFKHVPLLELVN
jgi:hypothetical protein